MKQSFPTLHIASSATGIALCEGMSVARMGEIAEYVMGHPVWTHELGDQTMTARIHAALVAQFPNLPTREDALADWHAAADKALAAYGETIEVERGTHERSEGPIESLSRMLGEAS